MRDRKKPNLNAGKIRTLQALRRASPLSRAQLTMGPLRYLSEKERNQVLQQLISDDLIREEIMRGGRPGPAARDYHLTEKGGSTSAPQG